MSEHLLFALPGNEEFATRLAHLQGASLGDLSFRHFPDDESYVRVLSDVNSAHVTLVCTLDRPDAKLLPLYFLARTLKELGARSVGLVAPYLAYMRQDRRFSAGEAVTSDLFAALLSSFVDGLVTVDPHLHRHSSLSEIYSIPTRVLHAAEVMAGWIREHVSEPLLIGPDSESEQWVSSVAALVGAPFQVLEKTRRGDRDVEVTLPDREGAEGLQPVLVDDIVSSAGTMIAATKQLLTLGLRAPVCIAVHGIFAGDAYERLLAAGAARVVSSNSVPHRSNAIDLCSLLA